MCAMNLLLIFCFVLSTSFRVMSAQQFPQCGDKLFFTPNDAYDTNRHTIFSNLASKVISQDGYYNSSVGEGSDKVYAAGMCIPGNIKPSVCSECIEAASTELLQTCLNQIDSFMWRTTDTLCYVRHSNNSFFESSTLEPHIILCNPNNVTRDVIEFSSVWDEFIKSMIIAASTSSKPKNYAADVSKPIGFQRIYAFLQCIPGISSVYCDDCLRKSVLLYQKDCNGKQGTNIRRPVCYFEWEIYPFYDAFSNLNSPPPPPTTTTPPPLMPNATKKNVKNTSKRTMVVIVVVPAVVVGLVIAIVALLVKRIYFSKKKGFKPMNLGFDGAMTTLQPMQCDFKTLEAATDNFSDKNKLGKGGFGVVYKGTFRCGTEIAVKRLSIVSKQGFQEFKNEVDVVAKLQHINLVKLIGFCLEGEEKILIYEYLSNKSLDFFLFDPLKRVQLDWTKRYNIIEGIARGILYLHRDSRHKIIHRDLKVSNILLDDDMNPKIADFGLAKILAVEQTREETSRIAGTYGYMAPEYMNLGQFSMASDVYSFGVLVLEIISGKTSSRYYRIDDTDCNLVTYAWKLWRKRYVAQEFVDSALGGNYQTEQVARCIHVALLCVQANHVHRPKMCKINSMLNSSRISLPEPHEPGFCDT